jgi:hypothetical protein
MTRVRTLLPLLLALAVTLLSGCASTGPAPPAEWDGLVLRPNTGLGAVFVKPDAEIVAFTSVLLDPLQVSFSTNWSPNSSRRGQARRLNAADVAAIKDQLADLFQETFRAELARGGYALVNEPGPDTLRVTPAVVELYITAPDTGFAGSARTYVVNSGRMTLVAELRDSVTGEVLARTVDTQSGRGFGTLTWTNRATNMADARSAIRIWASALRRSLDEMYGRAKTNAAASVVSLSPRSGG